jgi:tRNA U34 2-thiouridine synthase MnmA/TrmU
MDLTVIPQLAIPHEVYDISNECWDSVIDSLMEMLHEAEGNR